MKPDIQALLDRAQDDAKVAQYLCENGSYDVAASRAYYAMFHAAEALLADAGQSYSSHGAVQGAFGREFCKTGRLQPKLHRWLLDAQVLRDIGDYGVERHVDRPNAEGACRNAADFVNEAEAHLLQDDSSTETHDV